MFRIRSLSEIYSYDTYDLSRKRESININRFIDNYLLSLSDLTLSHNEIKPISYLLQQIKIKKKEYEEEGITSDSICEIKTFEEFTFKKAYNLLIEKNCKKATDELSFLPTYFTTRNKILLKKNKINKKERLYRGELWIAKRKYM